MKRALLAVAVATLAVSVVSPLAQEKKSGESKHSQQSRPAGALILGRVVDASTNQPIPGAVVSLAGAETGRGQRAASTVLATDAGYFVFRDLTAGNITISTTAPGYLAGGSGQRRIGGPLQPISLTDDARLSLTIRLWREATLAGTITDDTGDPIANIAVSLLSRELLTRAPAAMRGSEIAAEPYTRTDATGAYRFTGLLPGEYVVAVPSRLTQLPEAFANLDGRAIERLGTSGFTPSGGAGGLGRMMRLGTILVQPSADSLASQLPMSMLADGTVVAYPPTFFPGTSNIVQAERITLASGEDRHGANFKIAPSPLARVTGRLIGPEGPLGGMAVHLIPSFASDSPLERTYEAGVTVSLPDGGFSFAAVPRGDYVVKAWRLQSSLVIGTDALPTEPTLWASVPVSVTDQSPDVSVALKAGSAIKGRIIMDGAASTPPPRNYQTFLSVAFQPAWPLAFGARLSTRVTPTFEFTTQGLPSGTLAPVLPNQFLGAALGYFESATQNGRDLMVSPIVIEPSTDVTDVVITLSAQRTKLTGSVTDAAGRLHPAAAIVVFPADTRAWIEGGLQPLAAFSASVSQSGAFSIDVRPGDYFVAAIDEARLPDWRRESVVLGLAAQATRLRIVRGENPRQELRVR